MNLSSALVTTFLISIGDNGISNDSIINDTQSKYCIECESNNKFNAKYLSVYTELYSYKKLQNNWDGYGGIRPDDEIINSAKKFINILKYNKIFEPKIMVSGNGEIGLFWKNQNNYIEVDFDEDGHLSFFYEIDGKVHGEDDIAITENIPDKLNYALNGLKNQNSTKNNNSIISSGNFQDTISFLSETI